MTRSSSSEAVFSHRTPYVAPWSAAAGNGFLGMSVYGAIGMRVAELVVAVPQIAAARDRQVRMSTFGAVRSAVSLCGRRTSIRTSPIVLADVEATTMARLDACFGRPETNPPLSSD